MVLKGFESTVARHMVFQSIDSNAFGFTEDWVSCLVVG